MKPFSFASFRTRHRQRMWLLLLLCPLILTVPGCVSFGTKVADNTIGGHGLMFPENYPLFFAEAKSAGDFRTFTLDFRNSIATDRSLDAAEKQKLANQLDSFAPHQFYKFYFTMVNNREILMGDELAYRFRLLDADEAEIPCEVYPYVIEITEHAQYGVLIHHRYEWMLKASRAAAWYEATLPSGKTVRARISS